MPSARRRRRRGASTRHHTPRLSPERDDRPRRAGEVLDFGLAKLKESDASLAATLPTQELTGEANHGDGRLHVARAGRAKPVDPRSDVFSLGVVIFEMTTSQRPFKGDTQLSLLSSILRTRRRPSPISEPICRAIRAHRQALPDRIPKIGIRPPRISATICAR